MFEYDVRDFTGTSAAEVLTWLNSSGEADWEAFAIEPMAGGGYRVWLKRQRSGVAGGLEHSQGTAGNGSRR